MYNLYVRTSVHSRRRATKVQRSGGNDGEFIRESVDFIQRSSPHPPSLPTASPSSWFSSFPAPDNVPFSGEITDEMRGDEGS